jgi:oxygen-independent coproporphyrinogen-3 oxidase
MKGHQRKLPSEAMPDRESKFQLFALARERFLDAGYEPIGMDHFARGDDELARARRQGRLRRNFQGYTVVPAPDVIGLGVSAIGDVGDAYVQNEKKLSAYQEAITRDLLPVQRGVRRSHDDAVRRHVIHELMCNFRVEIPEVEERFGVDFAGYFQEDLSRLREHEREGMVQVQEATIRATPLGELFVRNLAMCFDRYWRERHERGDTPVFSRTV